MVSAVRSSLKPHLHAEEVLVARPPWRLRACVLLTDRIDDDSGRPIHHSRGVQYLVIERCRITADHVYLDTQAIADLDSRLATGS